MPALLSAMRLVEPESLDSVEAIWWCFVVTGLPEASLASLPGAGVGVLLFAVAVIAGVVVSAGVLAFACCAAGGGAAGAAAGAGDWGWLLFATTGLGWDEPE